MKNKFEVKVVEKLIALCADLTLSTFSPVRKLSIRNIF